MTIIEEFRNRRRTMLAAPAQASSLKSILERAPAFEGSLIQTIYSLFDGETEWGALLPGTRVRPINEMIALMNTTTDAWDFLEEERGCEHPLRQFLPFIRTSRKTSIGVLLSTTSKHFGLVFEYSYSDGEAVLWSESLRDFVEGLFSLSLSLSGSDVMTNRSQDCDLYEFKEFDKRFLSRWPSLVYPLNRVLTLQDEDFV